MGAKRTNRVCDEIREMFFICLKGDASPVLSQRVNHHLQSCRECQQEFQLLKELQHLNTVSQKGAVDPVSFMEQLNDLNEPPLHVPTIRDVLAEIDAIQKDASLSAEDKNRQTLGVIHRFLIGTRAFLQSRRDVKAGKEWVKLEKRRATLMKKILDHPGTGFIRPILRLQSEAYVSRGLIFQLHGDTVNAESILSLAVVLHWALNESDEMETQRFMGELKFYEGDLDAAEILFSEALKSLSLRPEEQTILLRNLGNIHYARGNSAACKEFLEHAMTVSTSLNTPEYPARDLMNLSVIDFHQGAVVSARKRCQKALELMIDSPDVHLKGQLHANLGIFLRMEQNSDESLRHQQQALSFFRNGYYAEDAIQVMRNMALTYYENGDLADAESILKEAAGTYSDEDALRTQIDILLGRIQRMNSRWPEALKHIHDAMDLAEKLNERLLLEAARMERAFIASAQNDREMLSHYLSQTSALNKSKPVRTPTVFDLENEALLIKANIELGEPRDAQRSLRRLKRMLKQFKKRNVNSRATQRNASGELWRDLIEELQHAITTMNGK